MTQPLLEIDNLSIAFRQQGKTHTVVSELSLNIGAGETLALVGNPAPVKRHRALGAARSPLRRSATPAETFAFTASRCFTPMSAR